VAQLVSEMSGYVKSVQLMDFAVAMSDQSCRRWVWIVKGNTLSKGNYHYSILGH